jgi:hypothetical protein
VRRLGWGTFTLEAEIVLKEPYGWVVDNSGVRQAGLELTWTLDFEGRGCQGRVRAKVKKYQETPLGGERVGERVLRSRRPPTNAAVQNDDDENDEEDDDFDEDETRDDESSSEDEEEASEFMET